MRSPRSTTVGASSSEASSRSLSSMRVSRGGCAACGRGSATSSRAAPPPAPPAIGRFTATSLPLAESRQPGRDPSALVDLLELGLGPLDGILGLHALDRLGVHVDDDVLREYLRCLARGGAGVAEDPRVARGRPEDLERLVDLLPHRVVLPRGGGGDAVALAGLEP